MPGQLQDRVAIITGAAGGIGSAVARRYAQEGATVVLADIVGDRVEAIASELRADGARAVAVRCDIAVESDIDAVVAAAAEFGRIDILANIAQGGMEEHAFLETTTAGAAERAFRTGPLQSMLFMQKVRPFMQRQGYGRIINTGSHSAVVGQPGFAPYIMAKGAVQALTRSAAHEWAGDGITVNTFLPVIRTPAYDLSEQGIAAAKMIEESNPTGRFGTPYEDCAPVLVFLASEGAGYVNGQVVGIDGGMNLIA